MEIFKNNQYPIRSEDLKGNKEYHSVDVITYDKDGMLNIGYWNYDSETWGFHTDTLCDPYEGGKLIDFVWMYRPKELKCN
jgi:hypothetical protein